VDCKGEVTKGLINVMFQQVPMNKVPTQMLVPHRKRTSLVSNQVSQAELQAMVNLPGSGGVVFDVGAHRGEWTACAAELLPGASFHVFEPDPEAYAGLAGQLRGRPAIAGLLQNALCGAERGWKTFYRYKDSPSWNTAHRRVAAEAAYGVGVPSEVMVPCLQLDEYCRDRGIQRIRLLRINAQGSEWEVLAGARGLLSDCRVDVVQFTYGGTFRDAGRELREVFELLEPLGYDLYKLAEAGLVFFSGYDAAMEDFAFCQFVAVHSRFRSLVQGLAPEMIDIKAALFGNGIRPKGVVHVGAHLGSEVGTYLEMGFEKILLIEANPELARNLKEKYDAYPQVSIAHCAASSESGFVELNITNGDQQSSSILPLGLHSEVYPQIQVQSKVRVPADTVDNILASKQLKPEDFNFLNVDIQGAELLALKGATQLLEHIRAINSEVNFAELYQGCPLFFELNDWLKARGFRVVKLCTPYHETWGDGFFVR